MVAKFIREMQGRGYSVSQRIVPPEEARAKIRDELEDVRLALEDAAAVNGGDLDEAREDPESITGSVARDVDEELEKVHRLGTAVDPDKGWARTRSRFQARCS